MCWFCLGGAQLGLLYRLSAGVGGGVLRSSFSGWNVSSVRCLLASGGGLLGLGV